MHYMRFFIFLTIITLYSCVSTTLPSFDSSIPAKSSTVQTSLTYDQAAQKLLQLGYAVDTDHRQYGQLSTGWAGPKHSTSNTSMMITGIETAEGMQFFADYKLPGFDKVDRSCKCGMKGSIGSAPFYDVVHTFSDSITGYSGQ